LQNENQLMNVLQSIADWFYRSRRKLATVAVGLLACLLTVHVVLGANGMVVYQHKKAEYRALDKEIEDLKRENERLAERVKALKTDPKTIEKEAREQLRYTRPGEVVYVLPGQEHAEKAPASATAQNHP
jgi:cell division protein FtsB